VTNVDLAAPIPVHLLKSRCPTPSLGDAMLEEELLLPVLSFKPIASSDRTRDRDILLRKLQH
jgi:hypothetical protein